MNHPVTRFLTKTGRYSKDEIDLLEKALVPVELPKEMYLLKTGDISSSFYFLEKGAIIQFRLNEDSDKHVIELNGPDSWVLNYKSFSSRKPSEYSIQAYEDCILYELTMDAIHQLIAQSQAFLQMGSILSTNTTRLNFFDTNASADEKYNFLLSHQPKLLQLFPQKLIASYLKITPETLSRVRSRI